MKKFLVIFIVLAMIFVLASCGKGKNDTVTVSFDTDGGSDIEVQVINKGAAVVKPDTPKKTGYIFDKWTLNGAEYEFGTAVNEDITLKAVWVDPNSGENNNGGENSGGENNNGGGNGGESKPPETVQCDSLSWVNNWFWIQIKTSAAPDISVSPESARKDIVFSSTDTSIATVDENGMVYGVAEGKCTIVAQCGDKKAELPMEIRLANGIYFSVESVDIDYNAGEYFNAANVLFFKNDAVADKTITWISSDPDRFPVDSNGIVTPRNVGITVIYANDAYNNQAKVIVQAYGKSLTAYTGGRDISGDGLTIGAGNQEEVSLVEDTVPKDGNSKTDHVCMTCSFTGDSHFTWAPQTDYYGLLKVASDTPAGDYIIHFRNADGSASTWAIKVTVK